MACRLIRFGHKFHMCRVVLPLLPLLLVAVSIGRTGQAHGPRGGIVAFASADYAELSARRVRHRRSRAQMAAAALQTVEPKAGESEDEFQRWSESLGTVISPKVQLTVEDMHSGEQYRGVFAVSDVGPGDKIFENLPLSLTILEKNGESSAAEAPCQELAELWDKWAMVPDARLAVHLLWGRQKHFASYWRLLFKDKIAEDVLPWSWGPEAKRLLSPTLAHQCEEEEKLVARRLQEFREFAPESFSQHVSDSDFALAWFAIRSRCFRTDVQRDRIDAEMGLTTAAASAATGLSIASGLGVLLTQVLAGLVLLSFVVWLWRVQTQGSSEVGLLPWVDLVNHTGQSPSVSAFLSFDPFASSFAFSAVEHTAAGEELFVSYGPKGNDTLLQYYSFVEEDNVHDYMDISLSDPSCRTTLSVELCERLEQLFGRATLRFERGGSLAAGEGMDNRVYGMSADRVEEVGLTAVAIRSVLTAFAARHPFGDSEETESKLLSMLGDSSVSPGKVQLLLRWRAEKRRLLREALAKWTSQH